ncbi:uracil-DNA glycosylase [Marmoricola endophyticus]|uniref:Type-5 uracil-DNA glycosylase n=1 Tax=Marmoricola endophyticus TaxID=2040280 RepID=A0A917BFT2_9ACTN|nr:uracil-DNA glycosylase [Marmoricola endophyticus]GGF42139.1 uracil-DNA glycosylase [Marmoricola endophyticus]
MSLLPHPGTGEPFASPVPPGAGWPGDLATPDTRVARTPGGVARLAARASLDEVSARLSVCRACPRLVTWREDAAVTKRASYADEPYWGRPAPGFGSATPSILVVGLAPAAHGGNRTGRNFTGDLSADWLHASLHRTGLAAQPTSTYAGDGQRLEHVRLLNPVRCAPPENRPTPVERDTCAPWMRRELTLLLPSVRAVVCLGAIGWRAAWTALGDAGVDVPRPLPRFGHAVEERAGDLTVVGCYHPSPHNTYTGRLTADMLDAVLRRARGIAGLD